MIKRIFEIALISVIFAAVLLLLLANITNARIAPPPPPPPPPPPSNLQGCATVPYIGQTVNSLAPWYCSQINQAVYNNWKAWEPAVAAALMVSYMIGALIFMIGTLVRNNRIREFGIGELYEATATLLIAVFFMFIAAVMFGLIPSFVTGPIDPYNTSLVYINNSITTTENIIRVLYNNIMYYSYVSSIELKISSIAKLNFVITNVLMPIIDVVFILPARSVMDLFSDGLLMLHIEFYLILFGMYAAIPVFLIPGILLRALFPTRGIGGMFIGIAIGFYFIMPILFSVAYYFTNRTLLTELNSDSSQLSTATGYVNPTDAASPSAPAVLELKNINSTLGLFWLSIMFFPVVIMAITYFSITTIAQFIGGMVRTSSRLKLL